MSISRAAQADGTKRRILDSARAAFASQGFDRVTIRTVASSAAVDPALVMRYFGSKEGLFEAATAIDLGLPQIAQLSRERQGEALADHFFTMWESAETGLPLQVLLAAAGSGAGRAQITHVFETQLAPVLASGASSRAAALIASQLLGFAFARYVLHLAPIVALDRAGTVEWLAPTLQHYLDAGASRAET